MMSDFQVHKMMPIECLVFHCNLKTFKRTANLRLRKEKESKKKIKKIEFHKFGLTVATTYKHFNLGKLLNVPLMRILSLLFCKYLRKTNKRILLID